MIIVCMVVVMVMMCLDVVGALMMCYVYIIIMK